MPGGTGVPAGTGDERELLLSWLNYLRAAVVRKAAGLDPEPARWRPDGRLTSVAGLINHLTHVELRWIDGGFTPVTIGRSEAEFSPDRPIEELVTSYTERGRRTDAFVRRTPLSEPCRIEPGTDLRWVLLHLINETGRHAGHADAVRELLDGTVGE